MKKHNFTQSSGAASGVAGRKNSAANYSGTGSSRTLSQKPSTGAATEAGPFTTEKSLQGPTGVIPKGTAGARYMSAKPGQHAQAIGDAEPLINGGKAVDVIGTPPSGKPFAAAKPRRVGKKL